MKFRFYTHGWCKILEFKGCKLHISSLSDHKINVKLASKLNQLASSWFPTHYENIDARLAVKPPCMNTLKLWLLIVSTLTDPVIYDQMYKHYRSSK